jgi:endo-1,4-beta-xylanase
VPTRRNILVGLGAAAIAAPAAAELLRPSLVDEGPSLRALAASKGLLFGAANNNYWLRSPEFAYAFQRDCGILVPEYELKRDLTEPSQRLYDFSAADALLSFASRHGMLFRGHPLVWYASNPPWLEEAVASARDESIFAEYVRATALHFAGRVHSWDVVNEAIEVGDGRADGLRDSFWLKKFGPSYIDHAFAAAHEADPAALLVYNDYGLESDTQDHDRRRAATLKLVEGLIARGVPIGALGLQGHITAFGPKINQGKLRAFLDEVRATGLRILVTEHDVDDGNGPIGSDSRDQGVADASRRFLDVALDNHSTIALLTWGLSDKFLKAEGTRNALLRGTPRKLPLDAQMQPTPMRGAIAQAIASARRR